MSGPLLVLALLITLVIVCLVVMASLIPLPL